MIKSRNSSNDFITHKTNKRNVCSSSKDGYFLNFVHLTKKRNGTRFDFKKSMKRHPLVNCIFSLVKIPLFLIVYWIAFVAMKFGLIQDCYDFFLFWKKTTFMGEASFNLPSDKCSALFFYRFFSQSSGWFWSIYSWKWLSNKKSWPYSSIGFD